MANAIFTPVHVDTGATIIAPQCLAKGSLVRGTINLAGKVGAEIKIGIGRGGITALSTGINVEVRKTLNAGGILMRGAPWFASVTPDLTACILKLINNGAGYGANTSAWEIDGTGTPAADGDFCCWGVDTVPANAEPLTKLEFVRVSKFSGTTLTIDSPCKQVKVDNEILTSKAEEYPVWCPGGFTYEVVIDYGDDANGESVAVVAYVATYDSDQGS